nr:acetamidase/formamidase family protein [Paraburkholderia ribeironis]
MFSAGNSQGDGEVCGTAIENPVSLTARFELIKKANQPFPCFTTPGPVSRQLDTHGYEVTTGMGPDLM